MTHLSSGKQVAYSLEEEPHEWKLRMHGAHILVHSSGYELWVANGFFSLHEYPEKGKGFSLREKILIFIQFQKHWGSCLNVLIPLIPLVDFIFKKNIILYDFYMKPIKGNRDSEATFEKLGYPKEQLEESIKELLHFSSPGISLTSKNRVLREIATNFYNKEGKKYLKQESK